MTSHASPSAEDRIERHVRLRAPLDRVWRALADARELGAWFGFEVLEGAIEPGSVLRARITHEPYRHVTCEIRIEEVVPQRRITWRWHPYAVDPSVDYSKEPMTRVTFDLTTSGDETIVTVVESGFDQIPTLRRDVAFRSNSGGWTAQMDAIARHVQGT